MKRLRDCSLTVRFLQVLRALGVPVTESTLKEKIKTLQAKGKRTVTKDSVSEIANEFIGLKKNQNALIESFRKFSNDREGNKITATRLTNIMRNVGERMPEHLVNCMIKDTAEQTDSTGLIDYAAFSKKLARV